MAKEGSGDDTGRPAASRFARGGREDWAGETAAEESFATMPDTPAYHEHLLDASDVCNSCHRVIRVERQDPTRGGLTREYETHQERHRDHTVVDYGPADTVGEQQGTFCDRCGTESPWDRYWDDHRTDSHEVATALGWLDDVDEPAVTACQEREVSMPKFRELLKATIRTLESKGVTIDRTTLAREALRRRRDGEHVDDCLGEATEAAIRRAISTKDAGRADARREVPA